MKIKLFFIIVVGCLFLLGIVSYTYFRYQKKSSAVSLGEIVDWSKVDEGRFFSTKNINQFSFYERDDRKAFNFSSKNKNLGIKAFTGSSVDLKDNNNIKTILPAGIIDQLILEKKISEADLDSQHFFYEQQIKNLQVYGAHVNLHLDGGQIYGLDGNVITNIVVPQAVISDEDAQNIALNKANRELKQSGLVYVYQSEKYILNKRILGINNDDSNYLVLAVWIRNEENRDFLFSKKYFVDLVSGSIIYEEEHLIRALNRQIVDDKQGKIVRKEGQAVTGDTAVDKTYNILGNVYNFYSNSFKRDSYNGKGAALIVYVHIQDPSCPNAFSLPDLGLVGVCDGMYTEDIIGHEFGHMVIGNTILYQGQSGIIQESLADIFGNGIDPDNWTMGEGTVLGVMRRYDDPTAKNQPDRLFSDLYYCGTADGGGLHQNNGVLNKGFYLMVQGGNFNGCSIKGIGREKTHQIIYRALTTYLAQTSNLRDVYEASLHACEDLYGASSTECLNTKQALQAIEIDQQPAGTQKGARCAGIQRQVPACVSAPLTPTGTVPSVTAVISPSLAPSVTVTPMPTVPLLPTVVITPSGNVELDLKLKFQGIEKKPSDTANKLYVKLTVVSDQGENNQSYGEFTADANGIWTGKTFFNMKIASDSAKYKILVKGPMHMQKRVCDPAPTEEKPGLYHCKVPNINLRAGVNTFDFSKIILLGGDLPVQDGVVNSYDLSLVRQRLGAVAVGPQIYDINMDGVINVQDYSLIIFALSTRFDE